MVSWVWNHFKKLDKECARCKHCAKKINCKSSNTTGFARHLRDVHSITANSAKQNKIENFINVRKENSISSNRKQLIDKLIIDYIIMKTAPLNTVEDEYFRKLIHYFESTYQLMSCSSLKVKINEIFEKNKNKLINLLDDIESVSIDFDSWTSIAHKSYITVNCHGLTNDWKIVCFNLETKLIQESHCSKYLKDLIEEVLIDYDLEYKTQFCVHDNAANMNLVSTLLGLKDIRCFAHCWDLAVKEALTNCDTLQSIIAKSGKIVGHFNHSSTAQ